MSIDSATLHPWQARVVVEKAQLDEKIVNLRDFLSGDHFSKASPEQRNLLGQQYTAMKQYSDILRQRIEAF